MGCTPDNISQFMADVEKKRGPWLNMANRSWGELKKQRNVRDLWAISAKNARRRGSYPAWYSIFKIRQPLLLSRIGIPIGKDTSQEGNDHVGATAAVCLERLATNLVKTFDFFDVLCRARDDFLATCFSNIRSYYMCEEVKQRVKVRIEPVQVPGSEEVVFLGSDGKPVTEDNISQDDEGWFYETDEVIGVENEKILLRHVLYKNWYIDPDVTSWDEVERLAFLVPFSKAKFTKIFGRKALDTVPKERKGTQDPESENVVNVIEYWDLNERKCYWMIKDGMEFITPKGYQLEKEESDEENENPSYDDCGLYKLSRFYPCPAPLITNQSTDEFWPIPEYFQLYEILEDIHTLFSRMMSLTRAIRARLLFDNSIEGLAEAINEAAEGDAFGVPNLAQALVKNGGTIENVLQYIPVKSLIESLAQVYGQLEQRLNVIYRLTGTSDLLQGLASDPTQRTLGERQMLEKYALNQMAEPQRKMQEFVRAAYQLVCEMALKNFNDASLEKYVIPRTLSPEHQARYKSAIELLKSDPDRFRVELETDSTVALNEQYDKQMRVEFVNVLTNALEKTANIAQTSPALVIPELNALKHLIGAFRQGKMFQEQVTAAIDNVIKQAESASQSQALVPPSIDQQRLEFDKQVKSAELTLKQATTNAEMQIKQSEINLKTAELNLENARFTQEQRLATLEQALERFKAEAAVVASQAERAVEYEKLRNDIFETQAKLQLQRDELMVTVQKNQTEQQLAEYGATTEERLTMYELQLREAQQQLDAYNQMMIEREKWATEQRLQAEHELDKISKAVEIQNRVTESNHQRVLAALEARNMAAPPPPRTKRKISIKRNETGDPEQIDIEGGDGYRVIRDEAGNTIGWEPISSL